MSGPLPSLHGILRIRGDFAQNVLRLFAANALAQMLTFAAYPILTRLYGPDQLGILSTVFFAMMLLTPVSTLRYEIALPLCRDATEAGNLVTLCLGVVLTTSVLIGLALLAAPTTILGAIGPAAPYRMFLPLALLAFRSFNVLIYEATRVGRYADIAKTRVSQALVGPSIQIALGVASAGTVGLMVGFTAGLLSGMLRLSRGLIFTAPSRFSGVTVAGVLEVALRYRRFPLFSSWAGVLLAGSTSLGNIVFTSLYGATVGGFLFLGDRVLMQPLRVSGNALLQVYVGEAGRVLSGNNPAEFSRLFVGVLWKQAALSAAWLGGVYLCATVALPLLFGHTWAPASQYIDVMLVGYFPAAAAIPTSHTLLLIGRQRLSAALDALRFAALLASVLLARHLGVAPITAVLFYSLTQGVTQCMILGVMYSRVRGATVSVLST
jgi:O-antigen/teichoic acid export membrane protein